MKKNLLISTPLFLGDTSPLLEERKNSDLSSRTKYSKRLDYFQKFYDSVKSYGDIKVFLLEEDLERFEPFKDYDLEVVTLPTTEKIFLAADAAIETQKRWNEYEYIWFIEPDLVAKTNPHDALPFLADETQYISAHRFDRLMPPQKEKVQAARGDYFTEVEGDLFFVCNIEDINRATQHGKVYHSVCPSHAFSSNVLMFKKSFNKTNIIRSTWAPVENATGFSYYETNYALKTVNITDFFVEHLSGQDINNQLSPL